MHACTSRCHATSSCLAATAVGIAVADVALIRSGHPTLSSLIRTNRVLKGVVVYLALHLLVDLRCDPLHWLGVRLMRQPDANLR